MECKECCREITEEDSRLYKGYCKSCYKEKQSSSQENHIKNKLNPVASKISLIVSILHFLGYGITLICTIILFANEEVLYGIVVAVIGIAITLLSTIILEALAEILYLLDEINKKK